MSNADPEPPLRRDVRLLGDILGRVLVEQAGGGLLADEERICALSRKARHGGRPGPRSELAAAVGELPLEARLRLSRLLRELDDPELSASGHERIRDAIAEEVTALWETDEVRSPRPRVVDEIRHGRFVSGAGSAATRTADRRKGSAAGSTAAGAGAGRAAPRPRRSPAPPPPSARAPRR